MALHLRVHGLSDVGRTRVRNEDSLATDAAHGIAVVADGMGGHPGGDVASRIATAETIRVLGTTFPLTERSRDGVAALLGEAMVRAVTEAHQAIRVAAASDEHLDGMGTTLTAMMLDPVTGCWAVGHVGDSRAYRVRQAILDQLTRDDTWVQDRVDDNALTAEQARNHPFGHILSQCVGLEESPQVQVVIGDAVPGDVYMLCTDGLVGMLDDGDILHIITDAWSRNGPADAVPRAVGALLGAANDRGGRDNISVALIACSEAE